jgi:hypothetical protein
MRAEHTGGESPEGSRAVFEGKNWFLSWSICWAKQKRWGYMEPKNRIKEAHICIPFVGIGSPPPPPPPPKYRCHTKTEIRKVEIPAVKNWESCWVYSQAKRKKKYMGLFQFIPFTERYFYMSLYLSYNDKYVTYGKPMKTAYFCFVIAHTV